MTRIGRVAAVIAVALAVLTFANWNRTTSTAVEGDPALVGDLMSIGATLFQVKGCASCHSGPDSISRIHGIPPLTNASDWAGDRRPGMSAADYLAESMRNPSVFISPEFRGGNGPMTGMPDLNLDESEIVALVAYLLST
ncbi:MAG: c-type cytochrome [Ilumatobacteraceae bacterium]